MAKTRSRSLNLAVKKEEHQDKIKLEQVLHSTKNASKSISAITKNRNSIQLQKAEVKSENADDNKVLLASPKKRTFIKPRITAEQITNLIGYIVNDKMSVAAAARKVGLKETTAYTYYHKYQADPEHKIPLPKTRLGSPPSTFTQQNIDKLIQYIVNDGMKVTQAARKADISRTTAEKYYSKYLDDPERKIPLLADHTDSCSKRYTQEEITDLIGYIVRDKMTVFKASKKANMSYSAARNYYLKYLHSPNHKIPDPCESNQRSGRYCTNNQVASLIGYIVNDGMTLVEASVKANMGPKAARRYYRQYLNDPEKRIPTPETKNSRVPNNPPSVDQAKIFFCSVIIDELSVTQAARKAKISDASGYKYYTEYLKSPNNESKIKDMTYSAEKMKRLVKLVQNENMNLKKAAEEVNLNYKSACDHYKKYLKDPQYEFPPIKCKQYAQEDIKRLINHIQRDKMSVSSAAKRVKMSSSAALKYYKIYQNDPKHGIPMPRIKGQTIRSREFDKYTQIIADIYKNNPSIKPIQRNHDVLSIEVEKELEKEDSKMALKKMENN